MKHIYSTASGYMILRALDSTIVQDKKKVYTLEEQTGKAICNSLNLPFVPRGYIKAIDSVEGNIERITEKLLSRKYRVAIEDERGEIQERK